ncbi:MAG: aldo/keto reductase [Anaerolineae bacterium]
MRYIHLPGTELRTSVLGLGTASLGTTVDLQSSFRLLDAFLDHGGTMLDTASAYANWIPGETSLSEKTIGRWIEERGNRHRILIATKGGNPNVGTIHIPRLSPAEIRRDLEASLRNLRTDTIDLYYLHRDDPKRPVGEIVEELNTYVRAGQVRYLGCSNWHRERISAAQDYAAGHNLQGFSANQMLWNAAVCDYEAIGDPTIVQMDPDLWQYHQATGLTAVAYSSQANGFFSKLAAGREQAIGLGTRRMYECPKNSERLVRMLELSAQTGLTISQIVLGYILGQPFSTVALIGCQNLGQLADSVTAADVRLDGNQIRYIETEIIKG